MLRLLRHVHHPAVVLSIAAAAQRQCRFWIGKERRQRRVTGEYQRQDDREEFQHL
jgi:hypothetical protein